MLTETENGCRKKQDNIKKSKRVGNQVLHAFLGGGECIFQYTISF